MPQQYTGEALRTFEKIHVLKSYHYNKLYISPDNIIYHVNRHGFLHAYTAGKCKDYDGSKIYYIRDNLLTRENLLRESLTTFYHSKEEAKAAWEAMQADAEANTAEERPQEAATADGTTACGETITTTETEPQRAAERPQADAEPHNPANDQERQDAHKTTGRPQQTATDREETSPQKAANDQEPQEATTAEEKTTGGQTTTRTDKAPQEATQRPKRGTQPPHETATAPQPATVSEMQEPANDQEPKTAADCHREPATRSGQTTQGAATCHHPHSPATSPTEARNERKPNKYTPHTPKARHGAHSAPPPTAGPGATPKNREFWPILPFTGFSQNDFRKFSGGTHFGMYFRAGF